MANWKSANLIGSPAVFYSPNPPTNPTPNQPTNQPTHQPTNPVCLSVCLSVCQSVSQSVNYALFCNCCSGKTWISKIEDLRGEMSSNGATAVIVYQFDEVACKYNFVECYDTLHFKLRVLLNLLSFTLTDCTDLQGC